MGAVSPRWRSGDRGQPSQAGVISFLLSLAGSRERGGACKNPLPSTGGGWRDSHTRVV